MATLSAVCKNVRVRFAPSPTGRVHFGGLRTALYNYFFAKQRAGQFLLRIEDTDVKRTVAGAADGIVSTLNWLGIRWNEEPVVQSSRVAIYKNFVDQLIDNQMAYRCFCSVDRLTLLRKEALRLRQNVTYDNRCRGLSATEVKKRLNQGEPHVIRLRQPEQACVDFVDLVYGHQQRQLDLGDPILIKSDGYPTYHFAHVIDDHEMQISHVIRGEEWLTSTPIHVQLHKSFQWKVPVYAHLPVMLNMEGGKLSKRNNSTFVDEYKELGYYPEAIVNFTSFAGGGFDLDKDRLHLYSVDQLQATFDIKKVLKRRTKLDVRWLKKLNRQALSKRSVDQRARDLRIMLNKDVPEDYVRAVLRYHDKEDVSALSELLDSDHAFLWTTPEVAVELNEEFFFVTRKIVEKIVNLSNDQYNREVLATILKEQAGKAQESKSYLRQLRLALTGTNVGLPLADILDMFGKAKALERLGWIEHGIRRGRNSNCTLQL